MAKVLVVDDSAVDRHLASSLLEKRAGWTAVGVATGQEALAAMEREAPDLVLTDLQMPEMDGLKLVEEIRGKFPLVPVILMTAHGSEEIAVKALKKGASSYVPKRNLAQGLVNTAETVHLLAVGRRHQQRFEDCLRLRESHFVLNNDPSLVAPLLAELSENLLRMKICDEPELLRVTVALNEAVDNAIRAGNLEIDARLRELNEDALEQLVQERRSLAPYKERRVYLIAKESRTEVVYIVRDEGPGFDTSLLSDPDDPANLDKVGGRGMVLIWTFMDEVYHNERGNEITMIKRCQKASGSI
jgi:CheY-like chemotaxis protein